MLRHHRPMQSEPGLDVILLPQHQDTKHAFDDFRSVTADPSIDAIRPFDRTR